MQMLVGGDDHRGDFRPRQQLAVIGGDKIGTDLVADEFARSGLTSARPMKSTIG